jgi:hypothetical protein
VTVQGAGFTMLVDNSTATLNDVSFTGGLAELGPDSTLTVSAGSTLSVIGDLDAGSGATLNNDGKISVSGNLVGADSLGVNNGPFSSDTTTTLSSLTVAGAFIAGDDSYVYNNGNAAFRVAKDFTLGAFGFVYDGLNNTDTATFTVGGAFGIGSAGFVYTIGASSLKVGGDLDLGDHGWVSNGDSFTDAASLTVGGSFTIGTSGHLISQGASTLKVAGDLILGDGGTLENGYNRTDSATLRVGGSLSVGVSGGQGVFIQNIGASVIHVLGNVTLQGAQTLVRNGLFGDDNASFLVGGNVSLDANSLLDDEGASAFTANGNVVMGAGSSFLDYGTISVKGIFDPGPNSSSTDIVGGTFNAGPGSAVTTDSAAWEVLAGGQMNVAGAFAVVSGSSLTIDAGADLALGSHNRFSLAGNLIDNGAVDSVSGAIITVSGSGQVDVFGTLTASLIKVKGSGKVVTEPGGLVFLSP